MNTLEKVGLLGAAGKWDTCASSASSRKARGYDRVGDVAAGGICHSFTEDGRCISLFKTLMTNDCIMDCKYCMNSIHCQSPKAEYEPQELAKVFMHLYFRNYVEGIFLSSAICKNPDVTTERMLEAVNLLRNEHKFQGYIHFKILPGADKSLIKRAAELSDRLSINLEAPNDSRLNEITDMKDYSSDILRRQKYIRDTPPPAGQTTQLVVGGSDETDLEILEAAEWEYEKMKLKRVYYSAFSPISGTPLQKKDKTPLEREKRLYNVDFMMRKYGIELVEFREIMEDQNLPAGDPKIHLARMHFDSPLDINEVPYQELIRVPGIGPRSAERIIRLRDNRIKITGRKQLHSIGVVLKRADPFLKISGSIQTKIA
jgi:putative DNA modification/repair radical SAM protein